MKTNKTILLLSIFFICLSKINAGNLRISILTCGQGPDLYSTFGHSAVRVIDSAAHQDIVYNYGTFEFTDDIWFYVKFTRGKLKYMLDASSFEDFMYGYVAEGRSVEEQEINLSQEDLQKIKLYLENNLKPENKYYKYDFYYDNCSTRIRDIFDKTLSNKLHWNATSDDGSTMRQNLNPYIKEMPWVKWGFYLTLGSVTDVKATYRTKMFLPFELEKSLSKATLISPDGTVSPLIKSNLIILEAAKPVLNDSLIDPVYFTLIIVLLIGCYVSHMQFYRDIYWKWYDLFVFGTTGLLGLLIVFLWFFTDHQTTHWNFNLLWALPTHLLYLSIMLNYRRFYAYTIASGVLLAIALLLSIIFQPFHLATYIVIFILIMRLYVNYRYAKHFNVRRLAFSKIF
ncbi:MAG: DUF4105 domain-containing protein [Cytophagales bacterium]